MATQKKTMKLSYPHALYDHPGKPSWKVEQVTNSVDHNPGQYLQQPEVRDLVELGLYDITFVPYIPKH